LPAPREFPEPLRALTFPQAAQARHPSNVFRSFMETLILSGNGAVPLIQSANGMYSSAQACALGRRRRGTIDYVSTTNEKFRLNRKFRLDRAEGVIPSIAGGRNIMAPKILMMFGTTFILFMVVAYVYVSLALMTIATKTNTPNGWPGYPSPTSS
jgi:hypothetical protein